MFTGVSGTGTIACWFGPLPAPDRLSGLPKLIEVVSEMWKFDDRLPRSAGVSLWSGSVRFAEGLA